METAPIGLIEIDAHLPDDDELCGIVLSSAEKLFPGNPLGPFLVQRMMMESLTYSHRDDDEWT